MTNPDNVGGLPELPEPAAFMKRPSAQNSYNREEPYFTASQMRAYGELCRAAPAGGDAVAELIAAADVLNTGAKLGLSTYTEDWKRLDMALAAVKSKNSAPAGSGEVVVPAIERMLVDAYAAGMNGDNFDMLAARRNLSALLRKLQQGADYVMVPRDSAKMVTHVCSEWIGLFRDAPGIEKYERYSYEPAVEELRDEYAAIAASQGQEGGANG